jgi:O-antigen ligase
LAAREKDRFPRAYPGILTSVNPQGAHNSFVHVLAETGLLGAIPFAAILVGTLGLGISRLRHSTCRDDVLPALSVAFVVLGYLMTVGLLPGQSETLLLAWAIGGLTAVSNGAEDLRRPPAGQPTPAS